MDITQKELDFINHLKAINFGTVEYPVIIRGEEIVFADLMKCQESCLKLLRGKDTVRTLRIQNGLPVFAEIVKSSPWAKQEVWTVKLSE